MIGFIKGFKDGKLNRKQLFVRIVPAGLLIHGMSYLPDLVQKFDLFPAVLDRRTLDFMIFGMAGLLLSFMYYSLVRRANHIGNRQLLLHLSFAIIPSSFFIPDREMSIVVTMFACLVFAVMVVYLMLKKGGLKMSHRKNALGRRGRALAYRKQISKSESAFRKAA